MITRAFIDKIVREMVMSNFEPPKEYGCAPVRDAFIGYLHPYHKNDIENCAGFIPVECYPSIESSVKDEIGAVGNMRIIISDQIKTNELMCEIIERKWYRLESDVSTK